MIRLAPILALAAVLATDARAMDAGPTYADVLRRPDDVGLNLAYARKLIHGGNVNAASAVLERILLTRPDADDVRLMYMITLYRLDDLTGAKREADILAARRLPPELQGEYDRYAQRIVAKAKATVFSAYFGSGLRIDSDSTETADYFGGSARRATGAIVSMAGASVRHDVDLGVIDTVFAQLDVGTRSQFRDRDFDRVALSGEVGAQKRLGDLVLRGAAIGGQSWIGGDRFAFRAGLRGEATYELTSRLSVFGSVELAHQQFGDIVVGAYEADHNGIYRQYTTGLAFQADDSNLFTLQTHFNTATARDARFSFTGREIEAKWLGTFWGGQYMSVGGLYGTARYAAEDVDVDFTAGIRSDHYWRGRASYGIPVRSLVSLGGGEMTGAFLNFGELVLQTSIDYTSRDSNFSGFDYRNLGGEIMLTRRFTF